MEVLVDFAPANWEAVSYFNLSILSKYASRDQQALLSEINIARSNANFPSICLCSIQSESILLERRLFAALLLKNYVSDTLKSSNEVQFTPKFRDELISTYFSCDSKITMQILLTIVKIADECFPRKWENLLDRPIADIVDQKSDIAISLKLVEACLVKYVSLEPSDDIFVEISFICDMLGPPILMLIEKSIRNLSYFEGESESHQKLCQILHSLCFHDIPQLLNDNMLSIFNYLIGTLHSLISTTPEIVFSYSEGVKSACLLISLLFTKYTDDIPDVAILTQYLYAFSSRFSFQEDFDEIQSIVISTLEKIFLRYPSTLDIAKAELVVKDVILPNMTPSEESLEYIKEDSLSYLRSMSEYTPGYITRSEASITLLQTIISICGQPILNTLLTFLEYFSSIRINEKMVFSRILAAISLKSNGNAHSFIELSDSDFGSYVSKFIVPHLIASLREPILFSDYMRLYSHVHGRLNTETKSKFISLAVEGLKGDLLLSTSSAILLLNEFTLKSKDLVSANLNAIFSNASYALIQQFSSGICDNEFLPLLLSNALTIDVNMTSIPQKIVLEIFARLSFSFRKVCVDVYSATFIHSYFILLGSFTIYLMKIGKDDLAAACLYELLPICDGDRMPYIFQILAFLISSKSDTKLLSQLIIPVIEPSFWAAPEKLGSVSLFIAKAYLANFCDISTVSNLASHLSISLKTVLFSSRISSAMFMKTSDGVFASRILESFLTKYQKSKSTAAAKASVLLATMIIVTNSAAANELFRRIQPNLGLMIFKSLYIPYSSSFTDPQEAKFVLLGAVLLCIEMIKSRELADGIDTSVSLMILACNLVFKRTLPAFTIANTEKLTLKDLYSKDDEISILKVYPYIPEAILPLDGESILRQYICFLKQTSMLNEILIRVQEKNPEMANYLAGFV